MSLGLHDVTNGLLSLSEQGLIFIEHLNVQVEYKDIK